MKRDVRDGGAVDCEFVRQLQSRRRWVREKAWSELHHRIETTAKTIVWNQNDADDIVGQCVAKTVSKLLEVLAKGNRSFESERAFFAYASTIIRNHTYREQKKASRRDRGLAPGGYVNLDTPSSAESSRGNFLAEALATRDSIAEVRRDWRPGEEEIQISKEMEERRKVILFLLRYASEASGEALMSTHVENLNSEEVAAKLGKSRDAIFSLRSKNIKKIIAAAPNHRDELRRVGVVIDE